jgi:putative flippase GtrA
MARRHAAAVSGLLRPTVVSIESEFMSVALESLVPDPMVAPGERSPLQEIIAFVVVGGTGAVAFVLLSTFVVGAPWGPPKWLGSVFCYAVLILPVYLAHRRFTFGSDAPHRQALPRYAGVQMASLLLASLFSYVVYGVLQLPTLPASLIVTALTSAVSFLILKLWAFRRAPVVLAPAGTESAAAPANLAI